MTGKTFMNAVANGNVDLVQIVLNLLTETGSTYCVIGGLAVNAYAEPVVSLDLDLVVVSAKIDELSAAARAKGLEVENFEHSINISAAGSDLRVQLQTDPRYQDFIARAGRRTVLGYEMSVASLGDVLQGKLWAWADPERRRTKRQKDLLDIMRLVEAHPALEDNLPPEVRSELE
jgi:hypothetical protein